MTVAVLWPSFHHGREVVGAVQNVSSALLWACCCGHLNVARWLVTEVGIDARSERNTVRCSHLLLSVLRARASSCALVAAAAVCGRHTHLALLCARCTTPPFCWRAIGDTSMWHAGL